MGVETAPSSAEERPTGESSFRRIVAAGPLWRRCGADDPGASERTWLGQGPAFFREERAAAEPDAPPQESSLAQLRSSMDRLKSPTLDAGIERLTRLGVNARRWTSPDLQAQLSAVGKNKIRTLLCSAIDLDSVLPLQRTIALEHGIDLAAGVVALAAMVRAGRAAVVLGEDTPSRQVAGLRRLLDGTGVRLWATRNEYPQAQASLLVHRLLGRSVSPAGLPTDAGVLQLDAAAAVAVGRAFLHDEPMRSVPLGVYSAAEKRSHLIWAPVGITLSRVLTEAGVDHDGSEVRVCQALREWRASAEVVVGDGELTVFLVPPQPAASPAACMRCGWCVDACPARIHPAGLLDAAQQRDPELAERYGLRACIDCGICSYVCPSRLPLLEAIRSIRERE